MNSAMLTQLMYCFACLSTFLLIGALLRAKVKFFQKTFMPSSVIGGFIGLLLGPIVLKQNAIIPIPEEWLKIFSLLPGILIVPIVASVPLGLRFKNNSSETTDKGTLKNIILMLCIMSIVAVAQAVIGFVVNYAFSNLNPSSNIYQTFGWELTNGFAGGHGTAGMIGDIYKELNLPYWEVAQGVTVTTATFGLLGGIILGMFIINRAARLGQTKLLKNPADIPKEMKLGYVKDPNKQAIMGKETTLSTSIDTFTLHLAIIMFACGIGYIILKYVKLYNIPVLSSLASWTYSIIVMFVIWSVMCKLKIDWLIDVKVKGKISSSLTEYAIVASIISLPVQAVWEYIVPVMTMIILGLIITAILNSYLCKKYFDDFHIERSVTLFGANTGVFLTGMLLLRICDPDFESPALGDYSIAYSISGVIVFALFNPTIAIMLKYGPLGSILFQIVIGAIYYLILLYAAKGKYFNKKINN